LQSGGTAGFQGGFFPHHAAGQIQALPGDLNVVSRQAMGKENGRIGLGWIGANAVLAYDQVTSWANHKMRNVFP
jgi:hypothetical protein